MDTTRLESPECRASALGARSRMEVTVETHLEVALLAPVPFVFLNQARDLCHKRAGVVALGSRDFELFRELDHVRGELAVQTLIYPSQLEPPCPYASWRGVYVGHIEPPDGVHPKAKLVRPAHALKDPDEGRWAVYWELSRLDEEDAPVALSSLHTWKTGKSLGSSWPRGPMLIRRPDAW